ncbi:hypothetical protein BDB00DRAFT_794436 [Zychaea mexicana]|uniref:uncharacterized protein n=1 Tax=Zychaea mexicana TaxID=64656 RepID=UPI0022FDE918|nr:uncharacterized protein BDB00DRAFT_794436 [Zychaea mexicana]KAI9499549.1 hypothetical protein BDB00DRAFT_794436 [Zychaea mexicana]
MKISSLCFMLITLVRHGESNGNIMQQWQGITDGPLTNKGKMQAELLAHELSKYKPVESRF